MHPYHSSPPLFIILGDVSFLFFTTADAVQLLGHRNPSEGQSWGSVVWKSILGFSQTLLALLFEHHVITLPGIKNKNAHCHNRL